MASRTAASSRAHLHAIYNRKRGLTGEHQTVVEDHNEKIPGKVLNEVMLLKALAYTLAKCISFFFPFFFSIFYLKE